MTRNVVQQTKLIVALIAFAASKTKQTTLLAKLKEVVKGYIMGQAVF